MICTLVVKSIHQLIEMMSHPYQSFANILADRGLLGCKYPLPKRNSFCAYEFFIHNVSLNKCIQVNSGKYEKDVRASARAVSGVSSALGFLIV